MKRYKEAIQAFRRSVDLNPLNGTAWLGLGSAYSKLNDSARAVEAYRQAVQLGPTAELWNLLGNAYIKLRRWNEAARAFEEQSMLSPDSTVAWFQLGEAYCKQGDTRRVIFVHDRLRTMHQAMADEFFRRVVQRSGSKCQGEGSKPH